MMDFKSSSHSSRQDLLIGQWNIREQHTQFPRRPIEYIFNGFVRRVEDFADGTHPQTMVVSEMKDNPLSWGQGFERVVDSRPQFVA